MRNRGFTLIELLVVISIIGVIASIVLVSFSGSRDKAKLAKSQQFSANINHSLGAYAVGIWDFEDQDNPTADRSGFGNDGTLHGDTHFVANDVLGGHALIFDGVDDYVDCGNNPQMDITGEITIEFWAYPKSYDTARRNPICKAYGGEFCMTMEPGSSINLYYGTCGGNCSPYTCSTWPSGTLKNNTWVHIAWTKSPSANKAVAYTNGKVVQTTSCGAYCNTAPSENNLFIGDGYVSSFDGVIDNVRIYSEALSVGQIQQHYAQGAEKHGIALK